MSSTIRRLSEEIQPIGHIKFPNKGKFGFYLVGGIIFLALICAILGSYLVENEYSGVQAVGGVFLGVSIVLAYSLLNSTDEIFKVNMSSRQRVKSKKPAKLTKSQIAAYKELEVIILALDALSIEYKSKVFDLSRIEKMSINLEQATTLKVRLHKAVENAYISELQKCLDEMRDKLTEKSSQKVINDAQVKLAKSYKTLS